MDSGATAAAPAVAGEVLLVSCYELGHQPFAVASAWAQLEAAGFGVEGIDASLDTVPAEAVARARLVAISVPMHTALRLGVRIAARVRAANPAAHVCMFGLYASMNAEYLLREVAHSVIGGEFESALVALACAQRDGARGPDIVGPVPGVALRPAAGEPVPVAVPVRERLPFLVPRRDRLPRLDRYAELIGPTPGERRTVAYAETSRGCLHRCTHCPVTPVYQGRFFVVPREVVLADVEQQLAAGAGHVTFGDPDFWNGIGHSMAVLRELAARHPEVSFDVTIKVEHLLRHRHRLAELAELGCAFVISAVESLSDEVLRRLDKGHSAADVREVVRLCREAGLALRPTLVAFTPWTGLDDYRALCDFVVEEALVDHVDPIQLAIRLLLPPGSALLPLVRGEPWLGALAAEDFGYAWTHPDPRVDALHQAVTQAVEEGTGRGDDAGVILAAIRGLAHAASGLPPPEASTGARVFVAKLTEPWFCCAEPSAALLGQVAPQGGELSSCCAPVARDAPGTGQARTAGDAGSVERRSAR
ncbi:MAG: CUAEP/CCAEP-tail radical SAM protein [Polyangiaceae bacterium]